MNDDWRQAAESAGAGPEILGMLSAVNTTHGLHPCARGGSGEVGLGAAPDAYAALYVSHRGVTLAMEPSDAKDLASSLGLKLVAKNSTTHYVSCSADRFSDPTVVDRVRQAVEGTVIRSWKGPRWNRLGQGGTGARVQLTCPIHGYELSATKVCMQCDGVPPAL